MVFPPLKTFIKSPTTRVLMSCRENLRKQLLKITLELAVLPGSRETTSIIFISQGKRSGSRKTLYSKNTAAATPQPSPLPSSTWPHSVLLGSATPGACRSNAVVFGRRMWTISAICPLAEETEFQQVLGATACSVCVRPTTPESQLLCIFSSAFPHNKSPANKLEMKKS